MKDESFEAFEKLRAENLNLKLRIAKMEQAYAYMQTVSKTHGWTGTPIHSDKEQRRMWAAIHEAFSPKN